MGDCKLSYYISKYGIYIIIILFLIIVYYFKKCKTINDINDKKTSENFSLIKKNEEIKTLLYKTQSERDKYIDLYQKNCISADDCNECLYNSKKEIQELRNIIDKVQLERDEYKSLYEKHNNNLKSFLENNVKSMPFLAGMIADYLTYDIEILAKKLDWGYSKERAKKVISIREIRKNAEERIAEAKVATYQLEYLKALYPSLEDVLDTDYNELTYKNEIPEYDPIRKYITKEEWENLSESEKNQKALDNYIMSHQKTKWQIGRDYELYVGYLYSKKGFKVDYYGSFNSIDDLGRDLIIKSPEKTLIVQCKYWSKDKLIHEKHINQLFGTTVSYSIENNIPLDKVTGILITNTYLSERAKTFCNRLNIQYKENLQMGNFPRIKCNLGKDEFGFETKIYHLPMDQQYDKVKIDKKGEFLAFTISEAEAKGFRRAFKWNSNN